MYRLCSILALCLLMPATGCGDDPIAVSAPIGINIKIKSADATASAASKEKSITSESGNPWGAFITEAEAEIGGPIGEIRLDDLTVLLATGSTGVAELREVFDGTVDVQFKMDSTDNLFAVGNTSITDALEGRTAEFTETFDFDLVQGEDLNKMLSGSFKVSIGGPAAPGFMSKGAEAELQLTLTFSAFE